MLRTNPSKLGRCWEKMESICRLVLDERFGWQENSSPSTSSADVICVGETNKHILWKMQE